MYVYDYVSYFYDGQPFPPAGGVPTTALNVIEDENIYLRIADSVSGTVNCDVTYPNGTTEVLISNSSPSSPNHWGRKGKSS
jgi:hypothetical protein